jgi:DMSO/TMAO reductase YedYZ molybdopterin-dependent catalytic subunit
MKTSMYSNKQIRNTTIVGMLIFLLFIVASIFVWKWIRSSEQISGTPKPLRKVLDSNEELFSTFFSAARLSKTYPLNKAASRPRVNGLIGLKSEMEVEDWKLELVKSNGDTMYISLEEIQSLPKTSITFDFKCIEGWSQVTNWGGVKFSDFVKHYGLQKEAAMRFTGMRTPDGEYYVGIDNKSMMHPQTLLCYEVNGKPLPLNQGFPLRLIIPVKYGVKHLKRIGTMHFSQTRPPDYWFERGYDYYCGL